MVQIFSALSLQHVDAESTLSAWSNATANEARSSRQPLGVMWGEVQRLADELDHMWCIGAIHGAEEILTGRLSSVMLLEYSFDPFSFEFKIEMITESARERFHLSAEHHCSY